MNARIEIDMRGLVEAGYEGWAAWLNTDEMILEAVEEDARLAPLAPGAIGQTLRASSRGVVSWADVPQSRVSLLALFFGKSRPQPVALMPRPPRMERLRFVVIRMGGLAAATVGAGDVPVRRLGLFGYIVGWWDPVTNGSNFVKVTRVKGPEVIPCTAHPCWPKDHGGLGLAPVVLGLWPQQVPSLPEPCVKR